MWASKLAAGCCSIGVMNTKHDHASIIRRDAVLSSSPEAEDALGKTRE